MIDFKYRFYFFKCSIFLFISFFCYGKKNFVVVIPSYNNSKIYEKNLQSVFDQTYSNFRVIYIDDCSTDQTSELVQNYIKKRNQEHRTVFIKRSMRCGAMANHYLSAHLCKPSEIIVHLDGDDWLADSNVLTYLNSVYSDPNVWLTYGKYKVYCRRNIPSCSKELPQWVINKNAFREFPLITSHLRTFYASLFHRIKLEDLMFKGKFFPMACDVGFMMPLLEMSHNHSKFIDRILYIYNATNPIMDYKVNKPLLDTISWFIRYKKPYSALKKLPCEFKKDKKTDIIMLHVSSIKNLTSNLNKICLSKGLNKIFVLSRFNNLELLKLRNIYPSIKFLKIDFVRLHIELKNIIKFTDVDYITFCTDVFKLNEKMDFSKCIFEIEKTGALGFFPSLSSQNSNGKIIHLWNDLYAWQFGYGPDTHRLPDLWKFSIFKVKDINKILNQVYDLSSLGQVFLNLYKKNKVGLCCEQSKVEDSIDLKFNLLDIKELFLSNC